MVFIGVPPVDDIVNERYSDTVYRFLIWARYIRYSCPRVHTEQDIDTSISIQQCSDTQAIQRYSDTMRYIVSDVSPHLWRRPPSVLSSAFAGGGLTVMKRGMVALGLVCLFLDLRAGALSYRVRWSGCACARLGCVPMASRLSQLGNAAFLAGLPVTRLQAHNLKLGK